MLWFKYDLREVSLSLERAKGNETTALGLTKFVRRLRSKRYSVMAKTISDPIKMNMARNGDER
eukprot:scaffold133384_cov27-Attheya_sp.AAC.1